ncbi:hypothetical protein [Alkalihalobacillus trypoxylicola]|uniref:LURP-one-related family protein n=1 Tax=Alkalihalobacillus trypoxylicola TaxID=519424 RepID=A0A162D542_9BACI|nr:hypothetical protein [Alkalihalobacillus trypoxylicola]KYG28129.1 hypothetical protein AZF04_09505 [Alkalihalobacillus trypoxylicola]
MEQTIYIKDNFFSTGVTDIYDQNQNVVGSLDLKSIFLTKVSVLNAEGIEIIQGRFQSAFSNKWLVLNAEEKQLGRLQTPFFTMKKKYSYLSANGKEYRIHSLAFSKDYQVTDMASGQVVADFKRVSSYFLTAAYELQNHSNNISTEELIGVVMGVNAIQKRKAAASNSGGAH